MICKNTDDCSKYMANYDNPYPHQSPCEHCVDYQEPELNRRCIIMKWDNWISPIKVMQKQIQVETEGQIMKAIQEVGVVVDKQELIRCMSYDRNQYENGYKQGRNDAIDEFIKRIEKNQQDNWIDNLEYGITFADLKKVAEQMKGENK